MTATTDSHDAKRVPFNWTTATPTQKCAELRRLDAYFGTSAASPLHHDNRCEMHR